MLRQEKEIEERPGTVGYCFDTDPELGGKGYLIGLHRCQSCKVMQRKVSEQTVDAVTGKRSSKGNPVKYNRGDLVLTDCNVTGSNYGTPTKPTEVPTHGVIA